MDSFTRLFFAKLPRREFLRSLNADYLREFHQFTKEVQYLVDGLVDCLKHENHSDHYFKVQLEQYLFQIDSRHIHGTVAATKTANTLDELELRMCERFNLAEFGTQYRMIRNFCDTAPRCSISPIAAFPLFWCSECGGSGFRKIDEPTLHKWVVFNGIGAEFTGSGINFVNKTTGWSRTTRFNSIYDALPWAYCMEQPYLDVRCTHCNGSLMEPDLSQEEVDAFIKEHNVSIRYEKSYYNDFYDEECPRKRGVFMISMENQDKYNFVPDFPPMFVVVQSNSKYTPNLVISSYVHTNIKKLIQHKSVTRPTPFRKPSRLKHATTHRRLKELYKYYMYTGVPNLSVETIMRSSCK